MPRATRTVVLSVAITIVVVAVLLAALDRSGGGTLVGIAPSASRQAEFDGAAGMPPADFGEEAAFDGRIMPPVSGAPAEDRAAVGPRIVRTGTLMLRVDDAAAKLEEAKGLAERYGGFVADAALRDDEGVRTAEVTVRVPTEKFDALVAEAKALAVVILSESSHAEDVTAQFVDLDARLTAARAEEAQYLEILKKADTVEETLMVARALGEVRTRIESMEGQLRFLRDRTEFATLRLVLTEETRIEVPTRTWKPLETARQALRALVLALQGAADLLITLAVFAIGLLLPAGLLLWAAYRLIRRALRRLGKRK